MNGETESNRDWRNPALVLLGVVVAILVGVIVGFIASGGLDDDPEAVVSSSTITVPTTSTSIAESTVPPSTTSPTTTIADASSTVPPDTGTPGQITFTATEDTTIEFTDPTAINGLEPVMLLENDPPSLDLGLVRFQVEGLPDDAEIQSVTLNLSFFDFSEDPVTVHLVNGNWSEIQTTSADAPDVGETVASFLIPDAGSVAVDVSDAVAGNGQVDFYLATSSSHTYEIAAREDPIAPPTLVVVWNE